MLDPKDCLVTTGRCWQRRRRRSYPVIVCGVRSPEEAIGPLPHVAVSERELAMARQLVRALATEWVPEKHADTYRQELLALLERKSPATPPDETDDVRAPMAIDLMARLVASVEAAKQKASVAPKRSARYDVRTRRSG